MQKARFVVGPCMVFLEVRRNAPRNERNAVVCKSQIEWGSVLFAGLPPDEASERRILALQAYIDESGTGGKNSPENIFVLSGFVTNVREWNRFSSEWRDCLNSAPKIYGGFHMNKWAKQYDAEKRDEKLAILARIITDHAEGSIDSIIDNDDYKQIAAGMVPREIDSPYFFAFHHLIARFCDDCVHRGITERVKIAFDTNLIFGLKAKKWYQIVRDIAPISHRRILPVEPTFEDDLDALPLQAADMLAYLRTHRLNRHKKEFQWLEQQLDGIRHIPCQVLTANRIANIVKGQYQNQITPRLLIKWRDRFGLIDGV